ncbi:replication-relaxation family protein [Flindersiella endophytica]
MRSSLSKLDSALLTFLYQCRLATTSQLARLYVPDAKTSRYIRSRLGGLADAGFIETVGVRHRRTRPELAWYATGAGAELVEAAGEVPCRPYRMTAHKAAGPAQTHLLAVNEVGVLFVETARARGDECEPLDWTLEVAHRIRDGANRRFTDDHLIADALLHYVVNDPDGHRTHLRYFIELDRATMTVARLAAKIDQYARYYTYTPATRNAGAASCPAWQEIYPRFPKLLIVLSGKSQEQLETRINDLCAYCHANHRLTALCGVFTVGAVTLERLHRGGAFSVTVTPLLDDSAGTDMGTSLARA